MAACASFLPAQGPAYAARVGGSLRLARLCAHSGALWTLHAGSGPGFAGLSTVACESVGISLPWYGCYPFDGQYMGLWETLDFNAHMPAFAAKHPEAFAWGARSGRPCNMRGRPLLNLNRWTAGMPPPSCQLPQLADLRARKRHWGMGAPRCNARPMPCAKRGRRSPSRAPGFGASRSGHPRSKLWGGHLVYWQSQKAGRALGKPASQGS